MDSKIGVAVSYKNKQEQWGRHGTFHNLKRFGRKNTVIFMIEEDTGMNIFLFIQ